jgi:hypothetical protein
MKILAVTSAALILACSQGDVSIGADDAPLTGAACGEVTCPPGETCCNASCSLCTPEGGICTEQECDPGECMVTGCSGESCSEPEPPEGGACEWKPVHACYQDFGICERDPMGVCGWRSTPELQMCVDSH